MLKRVIKAPLVPMSKAHYSPAIQIDDFLFVAGRVATDFETGIPPEARLNPDAPYHGSAVQLQSDYIFKALDHLLQVSGTSLDNVVAIEQFFTGKEHLHAYHEICYRYLTHDRPGSTALPCSLLMVLSAVLEIDVLAIIPRDGFRKVVVSTDRSPRPIAGYSQAIRAGDWVFCAGAVAVDYRTAAPYPGALGTAVAADARVDPNFWYGSEISQQVEYIMLRKQKEVLEAAGSSLEQVVKAQVFLTNMAEDYFGFQRAWKKIFPKDPPATCVIPINGLGALGARVEINLTALTNDSALKKETIETDRAPRPLGHEPQAVRAGNLLFFSTVLAADEHGLARQARLNPQAPFHSHPGRLQMEYILKNVQAICEAASTSLEHVVKRQNYFLDLRDAYAADDPTRDAWPTDPPVSTTIQVQGPMSVPGCVLTMDVTAAIPDR
ncbi:MAG: hypothetical protein IT307_05950 [Chloroflexi bacterium]|nr:hypothetical protein [Chloroflexota bacterium]